MHILRDNDQNLWNAIGYLVQTEIIGLSIWMIREF